MQSWSVATIDKCRAGVLLQGIIAMHTTVSAAHKAQREGHAQKYGAVTYHASQCSHLVPRVVVIVIVVVVVVVVVTVVVIVVVIMMVVMVMINEKISH